MLKQRIITALILLPIVLWALVALNVQHFSWFVAAVVGLGAWEWARLAGFAGQVARVLYAVLMIVLLWLVNRVDASLVLYAAVVWWIVATVLVMTYPASKAAWQSKVVRLILGLLTLIPLWVAMIHLRFSQFAPAPELNPLLVLLYAMLIVWVADTGAYFAGRAWGKKKLAPSVSPGKSWAGVWGGVVATTMLAVGVALWLDFGMDFLITLVLITITITAVSVVGDLTESMFKREVGIKDSSQLLPGHGGVLDRIDSLNAAIPVFACLLMLTGWLS